MSFSDIQDQEVAVRLMRQILERGRIPNAMLFWGPGGVGKAFTAIELAKAVNCKERVDDACDKCLQCRKIAHGNHPDVKIVVPTAKVEKESKSGKRPQPTEKLQSVKKTRNIRIEHIEEVNEICSLRPYESEWRTVIFQDAERMNFQAQNHFLKMLEEPPGRTLFVLLTEYPRMLLPTIRSRCQMVRFRTLRPETVLALLQRERELAPETAESIAALSQGRMDRALDLVDSEKRDIVLHVIDQLREGADPVDLAEEFSKSLTAQRKQIEAVIDAELKIDLEDIADAEDKQALKEMRLAHTAAAFQRAILDYLFLWETWYRDELVYTTTRDEDRILNRDRLASFRDRVSTAPEDKVAAVEQARYFLERFINEERVFRNLFFALAAE